METLANADEKGSVAGLLPAKKGGLNPFFLFTQAIRAITIPTLAEGSGFSRSKEVLDLRTGGCDNSSKCRGRIFRRLPFKCITVNTSFFCNHLLLLKKLTGIMDFKYIATI
ncbi:hypothetical protein AVEN_78387-1 [Araneus ventricosus]|uniref:Uncharacterized protein n=1 Tax=Araneus ventricosus TaxID=182803 RepID=A0A4Y2TRG1_ARAVE|nr:hypothetical protein AVEN_78387-1 [Araneus ventricosus]